MPPTRSFLDELDPERAKAIRALGIERAYARGTAILHQGDDSASVLQVLEGHVKIVALAPQGKDLIVGFAGPGDSLGELAAVRRGPRSASVYALEPVKALVIPGAAFEAVLAREPSVALAVLRHVAARLAVADSQRLEFSGHDVLGRVARALVELCDRYGIETERGTEIALLLSQDELAAWTASSREGVARAMHLLRELRWVETARRRTVVLDLPQLRAYAEPGGAVTSDAPSPSRHG